MGRGQDLGRSHRATHRDELTIFLPSTEFRIIQKWRYRQMAVSKDPDGLFFDLGRKISFGYSVQFDQISGLSGERNLSRQTKIPAVESWTKRSLRSGA